MYQECTSSDIQKLLPSFSRKAGVEKWKRVWYNEEGNYHVVNVPRSINVLNEGGVTVLKIDTNYATGEPRRAVLSVL